MTLILIGFAALIVYACRWLGLNIDIPANSPERAAYLRAIPFAVLSALITVSVLRQPEQMGLKIVLIVVVGIAIQANRLRSRRA